MGLAERAARIPNLTATGPSARPGSFEGAEARARGFPRSLEIEGQRRVLVLLGRWRFRWWCIVAVTATVVTRATSVGLCLPRLAGPAGPFGPRGGLGPSGNAAAMSSQINLTLANGNNHNVATDGSLLQVIGGPTSAFSLDSIHPSVALLSGQPVVFENSTSQAWQITHLDPVASSGSLKFWVPGQMVAGAKVSVFGKVSSHWDGAHLVVDLGASFDRWVDVRKFGVVGDGSHDDTIPLQSAVEACPPGGLVYVPPTFTLRLTGPITVPDSITIRGDGGATDHSRVARLQFALPVVSGSAAMIGTLSKIDATNVSVPLSGLSDLSPASVGQYVTTSNTAVAGNSRTMVIVAVQGPTRATVVNALGYPMLASDQNSFGPTINVAGKTELAFALPTALQPGQTVVITDAGGRLEGQQTVVSVPDEFHAVLSLGFVSSKGGTASAQGHVNWKVRGTGIKMWCRDSSLESLSIEGGAAHTLAKGIDSTKSLRNDISTNNRFVRINVIQSAKGISIADYGPNIVGGAGTYPQNCENNLFDRVTMNTSIEEDGIWIPNGGSQSKAHTIRDSNIDVTRYAIDVVSGSFLVFGGQLTGRQRAAVRLVVGTDPVMMVGGQSENIPRLFTSWDDDAAPGTGSNIPGQGFQLTISGWRADSGSTALPADGQFVQFGFRFGLTMTGNVLTSKIDSNMSVGLAGNCRVNPGIEAANLTNNMFLGTIDTDPIVTSMIGAASAVGTVWKGTGNISTSNSGVTWVSRPGGYQLTTIDGTGNRTGASWTACPGPAQSVPRIVAPASYPRMIVAGSANDNIPVPSTTYVEVPDPGGPWELYGIQAPAFGQSQVLDIVVLGNNPGTIMQAASARGATGQNMYTRTGRNLSFAAPGVSGFVNFRLRWEPSLNAPHGGWRVLSF